MSRHASPLRKTAFRICAIAAGMLASGIALADAHLDPDLVARLAQAAPADKLHIVVSYKQSTPVSSSQLAVLQQLGIERGVRMRSLPIVGALATRSEIQALAQRDDVASIFWNAPLRYFNKEQREQSGAARVVQNPGAFGRAIPFSGAGVTVLVNDSGIDATHEDLKFGRNVVENVLAPHNVLASITSSILPGILPVSYIEGVPNTDLGSGHGTHCAGSVGGTGQRSNGLYRGAAPGAQLVGYGSGAVIFVLDAVGGLDYAATNQFSFGAPIRVTSNSWGSSGAFNPLHPVNVATYELHKRGIISVFAAGNDGPGEDTHNPYAQAPWVVSVGASEKDGVLTRFSSRGNRGETGTFTMPDGVQWTYVNRPTVVAAGVDIISTRDPLGVLPGLSTEQDAAVIAPAHLPFYTHSSGTSMATPHVAGVLALMFEANPNLTPLQAKDVLMRTATNMTGRLGWEAGAGHVNAWAAVAESARVRFGWGGTVNLGRTFNSNATLLPGGAPQPFSIDFAPVGTLQDHVFQVAANDAFVSARAVIGENTLGLQLVDPDGTIYSSGIALPVLGDTATVGAPAKPGTWRLRVRGVGSVSGVALDPLRVTNGYGLPQTVTGQITTLKSGGYSGLNDIATHPARTAIEHAVSYRLADGHSDGRFRPDSVLTRGELAQYLVMGQNIRQSLPFNGQRSFSDISASSALYPFAEAVVAPGGALRDLSQAQAGVMGTVNGNFRPNDGISRVSLAYSLVQSMALQAEAQAFSGELTAYYDGRRVPVADAGAIAPALRGYVQLALDLGLINARFSVSQGPYDLQPVISANFDPNVQVTRAAFAVAAGRYREAYQAAED
jgi:serine protease AprX